MKRDGQNESNAHAALGPRRWIGLRAGCTAGLFLHVYHPRTDEIGRRRRSLHDTVTRDERYTTMREPCQNACRFLDVGLPFPGHPFRHEMDRSCS